MANKCRKSKTILIRFRHRKKQPRRQRCNTTIIWWRPRNAHKTRNSIRNGRSKPTNKSIKTRANNISHERRTLIILNIRINKKCNKRKTSIIWSSKRHSIITNSIHNTHTSTSRKRHIPNITSRKILQRLLAKTSNNKRRISKNGNETMPRLRKWI